MIKDAAVGGLLKAAGVGRPGDLGIMDPLFVENQEDFSPGAHLVVSRSEAKELEPATVEARGGLESTGAAGLTR